MTVAADILADASRLATVYAQQIQERAVPTVIPDRVFVLQQNTLVLGVLTSLDRAVEDAHSLMASSNGPWTEFSKTMWRSRSTGLIVGITAHDVR